MAEKQEIESLSIGKIAKVAWRGIRIRIWRSMLVVSGIVLAIAFLAYILYSDSFDRNVAERGSQQLVERLTRQGELMEDQSGNERVRTFWMAGLALLISFVGIVNAMLMSVTERFREIGTMKCLGALDSFVLKLFMLESVLEGVVGTAAGLMLGLALSYFEGLTEYGNDVWRLIAAEEFLALLGSCFVIGLVLTVLGALYPARQASKMTPVMALRTEV